MDSEELVATLEDAGLSPYEAKTYVALLELGTASASELARASDVPQPRVYDVLTSLADRDYVETYESDSLRARAHSPARVLEDLTDRAQRLETAAEEVERRWSQPELESSRASIVERFQTVVDRARSFAEGADYQIQLSASPETFRTLRSAVRDAHERGVSVRVAFHTAEDESPPDPDLYRDVCTEARHRAFPAPFVALVDRTKTCFAHHRDSVEEYGVLVNDRTHTYVFHWYFLTCLWDGWPRIYSTRDAEFPIAYVDVRQFVRDAEPLVEEGATIDVRVQGRDVDTGREVTLEGEVVDFTTGSPDSATESYGLAGKVTLVVDTGTEAVTVGGWGAMIEDVEATCVTVLDASSPDGEPIRTLG